MTDEFLDIEKSLQRMGLPDDLIEVTGIQSEGPGPQAVERIKQRTLLMAKNDLQPVKPRRNRLNHWYAYTVAAAALFLIIGVIGPNNLIAQVNRLLTFIPGFGIQSTENVNLYSPNPVRAEKSGVKLYIRGLLADTKGTSLIAYVEGYVPEISNSYLVDESGQHYSYQGGSVGEASNVQILWAQYQALPLNVKQVSLVFPSVSNWTVNVPLAPVSSTKSAEYFGPSQTVNNVIVSGQATSFSDETQITLLIQSLKGQISYIGKTTLTGADGKTYSLNQQPGFGGSGLVYLSTGGKINDSDSDNVTVNIPNVMVQQNVNGSVTIPVPEKTALINLNQSIQLGGLSLNLTKAEILEEPGGTNLRVYVQPSIIQGEVINYIGQLTINGKSVDSMSSEWDAFTGGLKWFEFPLNTETKSMNITISQINVQVSGPWQIKLPMSPGF